MVQCAVFAGKEIKDCTRGDACICAKHAVGAADAMTNKCVYGPKDGCISASHIRPFMDALDRLRAENERLMKRNAELAIENHELVESGARMLEDLEAYKRQAERAEAAFAAAKEAKK